jgi:hypothetical protein
MQKFSGSCSPKQLQTLQSIFDLIWMELRDKTASSYSGPFDPDTLREEIARRVFAFAGQYASKGDVVREVLSSSGIQTPLAPSGWIVTMRKNELERGRQ